MDWAVLSYLCVCGRERDVICDCVCTPTVPPSVCVSVYLLRQVHEYACVCSHRELRALSAETDHPMMGDHWKIRLGFHTHLSMEMSNIKNWCHFLKVAPQSFFWWMVHFNLLRRFMGWKQKKETVGRCWQSSRSASATNSCSIPVTVQYVQDLCWVASGSPGEVHGCD